MGQDLTPVACTRIKDEKRELGRRYSRPFEMGLMQTYSKDGTIIAYEQSGQGPALVIVGGILGDRSQQARLAQLLASHFTVYNFDRRGRGERGVNPLYAVEREVEDIAAILDAAGGSAFVYGTSGCAVLSLEAAARGLSPRMKKLALWEPSYIVDDSRPPVPQDYMEQLTRMLREGHRGDMDEPDWDEHHRPDVRPVTLISISPVRSRACLNSASRKGPSFLSWSDQAEDHAAPGTLIAESFRLFGHEGLSDLRLIGTREQHLRWSHESPAPALTSPGWKHERSAMRHSGPSLRPQPFHSSSLSRVIGRSRTRMPVA